MSDQMSVDERVARWMIAEAPDDAPDRVLRAAFERTRRTPQVRRPGLLPVRTRMVLLAAAVLLIAASAAIVASGAWRSVLPQPVPSPDALQRIRDAGVVRVGVTAGHPQRRLADGSLDGFEVDVAELLARRLGVRPEIIELPAGEAAWDPRAWDVALGSSSVELDPARLGAVPTYGWPHMLLVPAASGARSVEDVRGQPICAVAGDEGQVWLLGGDRMGGGGSSAPPIPSTLVLRPTDAECLDLLRAGQVRAVVTATTSPADAAGLDGLMVIAGAPVERRIAVFRQGADAASLAEVVAEALDRAGADGSLAASSVHRFGVDLTKGVP